MKCKNGQGWVKSGRFQYVNQAELGKKESKEERNMGREGEHYQRKYARGVDWNLKQAGKYCFVSIPE